MKISWNWLQDFVQVQEDPQVVGERLTLHTAELEEMIETESGDLLFDIDNKSLTHRPDLMGHRGFARELSAIFKANLIHPEPTVAFPDHGEALDIEIQTDRCRRFCALKMEGVEIGAADVKTQTRLQDLGVNTISNLVDITNWIMLEYGQPMHVFDADKIEGKIVIRQAQEGESLVALDGATYELGPEDIVIADAVKVLSIAGIMGGSESGVTQETSSVIFESANFDPTSVRKTSQRIGLRSESSMRFEKSLDPELCRRALLSAAEKAHEACPASQVVSQLTNLYPQKKLNPKIKLVPQMVRDRSGLELTDKEIIQSLEGLGFGVRPKGKALEVEIPSFRATKDVSIPEDLVEEVVRMYGFANIPVDLPILPLVPPVVNTLRNLEWSVRHFLASNGMLEVYNTSFVDSKDALFTGSEAGYVTLENPLSEAYRFLRKNLISNMCKDLKNEVRTHGQVSFFEIGKVFRDVENEVLPEERNHLCLFTAATGTTDEALFQTLKQKLCGLVAHLGVEVDFEPLLELEDLPYLHPQATAQVLVGGLRVGVFGVLHPLHAATKGARSVFCELDLALIDEVVQSTELKAEKMKLYPATLRDISLVLPEKVLMGHLEKAIVSASPLIEKVECFDVYRDVEKLGEGVKNVAFHLHFRSLDGTLKDGEVHQDFDKIVGILTKDFDAQVRTDASL